MKTKTTIPKGYKLVPLEPTRAMIQAAEILQTKKYYLGSRFSYEELIWRAMIEACDVRSANNTFNRYRSLENLYCVINNQ